MQKINVYYTEKVGRRNVKGTVYVVRDGILVDIGSYIHYSHGADLSLSIIDVAARFAIANSLYSDSTWKEFFNIIKL